MSEATYAVAEVVGSSEWDGGGDASRATTYWTFRVAGDDQQYEIGRKPDNPLKVGDEFRAVVQGEKFGKVKLKRVQQQGSWNGGGPRPEDPVRSARILRQHSQDMAVQTVELAMGHGIEDKPESLEELLKLIRRTTDYFDRDVNTLAANLELTPDRAAARSEAGL